MRSAPRIYEKDYIAIATVIAEIKNRKQRVITAMKMAAVFQVNPLFDDNKFLKACGVFSGDYRKKKND